MVSENMKKIIELDVRDDIKSGLDPFKKIMDAVNSLKDGEALKITNSFEPFPLYSVLKNKGFSHTTESDGKFYYITFFKDGAAGGIKKYSVSDDAGEKNFDDEDLKNLAHRETVGLDVRGLEPPQPLLKIFEMLDKMGNDKALEITHERKPVHLYPRLKDAGYKFLTAEEESGLYKIKIWK